MTVIRDYMNQRVSWQKLVSGDTRNGFTYAAPTSLSVLHEPATGRARTITGDTTQVESRVIADQALAVGDLIEGSEVLRVVPVVDLDGTITEWEAFL